MRLRKEGNREPEDEDDDNKAVGISRITRGIARASRSIDLFPKAKEDYRRKQNALGGAVSTFAVSIIGLLVLTDLLSYAFGWNAYRTELSVDRGISASVPFDIDISFFGTPCHDLSLDAVDASGQEVAGIDHDIIKTPIDVNEQLISNGAHKMLDRRWIQEEEQRKAAGAANNNNNNNNKGADDNTNTKRKSSSSSAATAAAARDQYRAHHHRNTRPDGTYCGPCFAEPLDENGSPFPTLEPKFEALRRHLEGAAADTKQQQQCCNTCKDVMDIYDKHKFTRPDEKWAEQCVLEMSHKHPGCNVRGVIYLRKVQGAFFFAPGKGVNTGSGAHAHTFTFNQLLTFNSSHEIRRFRIGDPTIERFYNRRNYVLFPLEGRRLMTGPAQATVKYRLNIVPTAYRVRGATADDASYSGASGASSGAAGNLASETEVDEAEVSYEYQASVWHRFSMPAGLFMIFGGGGMGTPSVLFAYDFFSMQVTHVFDRPPFSVFLVRACSMVGGLFVILGLVDRATQYLAKEVDWSKLLGPHVADTVSKWLSYELMNQ